MKVTKNKILIIESSQIIREGLISILTRFFSECDIVGLASLQELNEYPEKKEILLLIINPDITQSLVSGASDIFAQFHHLCLIGLISGCSNREHLSFFDDIIYLSDDQETIAGIIRRHLHHPVKRKARKDKLTNREFDVLKLLIKGYPNKQIANELFISVHTVVTHRKNITAKLGIKSIAGLAIYGVINNIIDMDDYLD